MFPTGQASAAHALTASHCTAQAKQASQGISLYKVLKGPLLDDDDNPWLLSSSTGLMPSIPAQHLPWEQPQQRPGQIQGVEDGAVLVQALQAGQQEAVSWAALWPPTQTTGRSCVMALQIWPTWASHSFAISPTWEARHSQRIMHLFNSQAGEKAGKKAASYAPG